MEVLLPYSDPQKQREYMRDLMRKRRGSLPRATRKKQTAKQHAEERAARKAERLAKREAARAARLEQKRQHYAEMREQLRSHEVAFVPEPSEIEREKQHLRSLLTRQEVEVYLSKLESDLPRNTRDMNKEAYAKNESWKKAVRKFMGKRRFESDEERQAQWELCMFIRPRLNWASFDDFVRERTGKFDALSTAIEAWRQVLAEGWTEASPEQIAEAARQKELAAAKRLQESKDFRVSMARIHRTGKPVTFPEPALGGAKRHAWDEGKSWNEFT